MDDDWDLYAVVRSCKSSATASSMVSARTTSSSSSSEEEGGSTSTITPLSCLAASLTFEEENDPFSFPKLGEPRTNAFQELQQLLFKPACLFPNPPTTTMTTIATTTTTLATTTRNDNIIPDSAIVDHLRGSSGQHQYDHHHHLLQHQHHEQEYKNLGPRNGVVGPAQLISSPQSGFEGKFHVDQQQQEQTHNQQLVLPRQVHAPDGTLPLQMPLPPNHPTSQSPRSRKRKNQLKKQVCQVTAENLNSDLWAWRKYGQKPIKGSPYPRNYYRCSSSKGCAARKQVERSNVDPDLFIVTYTGDHTHPRPAHRNSLAGSTRAKTTTTATTTVAAADNSCSSPQSGTSLSPTTPHEEAASAVEAKRGEEMEMEMAEEKAGDGGEECLMEGDDEEDEENILIPNNNVMGGLSDEFFYGFQQLGYSPPGAAC